MRRFWCTSCFVGERLSDALLFASSNLTNTNSRADIKDIYKWSWTSLVGSLGFDLLAVDVLLLVEAYNENRRLSIQMFTLKSIH